MAKLTWRIALLVVVLALAASLAGAQQPFALKSGDTVVMLGDSITAQHLHSTYMEAYALTRYPAYQLRFRNSGVGGDTVPRALARLNDDVLAWKPTVVTIELGMNDSGAGPKAVEPYLQQMKTLVDRIRAAGAQPVFITASPVNDGTTSAKLAGRDATLDMMATQIVKFAQAEKLPVTDLFHTVLDIWGNNMAKPNGVSLQGDGVHPGPPGQLTMAWAALKGLGMPSLVSEAKIDVAQGKALAATNCQLTDLKCTGDSVTFSRLDQCLPMPIADNARDGLKLVPLAADLSHYGLTVAGLKPGRYDVKIDGVTVATATADELAAGLELGTMDKGPLHDQCLGILDLINQKSALVWGWRDISKYVVASWLGADLTAKVNERKAAELQTKQAPIEALDAKLHEAVQPTAHVFSVVPAAG